MRLFKRLRQLLALLLVAVTSVGPGSLSALASGRYHLPFSEMYKDRNAFLPTGVGYMDEVPQTLDIAEMAGPYIQGVVNTSSPNHYWAPSAATLNAAFTYDAPGPKLTVPYWGSPNWGEVMLAMSQAREMTAYDRNNARGTVQRQHDMMKNMLDVRVNALLSLNIVRPNAAITPTSYAMQAVQKTWEQKPNPALQAAMETFVRMHKDQMKPMPDGNKTYEAFWSNMAPAGGGTIGYLGPMYVPFIQGTALTSLSEWQQASGNADASMMTNKLSDFLRNYQNSTLWVSPNPARYSFTAGQGYAGHMYSWLEALHGILLQAKVKHPKNSAAIRGMAQFGEQIYQFTKNRTNAGYVGNFGSGGTTADMIVIGMLLSEMGSGDHYDEVEAWVRNQMVACQIDEDSSRYLENYVSGDWERSHVGLKAKGLFFADATHLLSIPPEGQAFTSDDHAMAFRGLYEVWKRIAVLENQNAFINFHLNYAGPTLDVKSEAPYRGRVEITTKPMIGALKDLYIHIPTWTNRSQVRVFKKELSGALAEVPLTIGGPYQNYARIQNIQPNSSYVMTYPMVVRNMPVYQMRAANTVWAEGSFPYQNEEVVSQWTGTFRGGSLVNIAAPAPTSGIPRYAEPWRKDLFALGNREIAAPKIQRQRFVHKGTARGSIPLGNSPASVTLTVDGKSQTTFQRGQQFTLVWASSNAVACRISWTPAAGRPGSAGSAVVTPNVSTTVKGAFIGSYSFTCLNKLGQAVTKTATVNIAAGTGGSTGGAIAPMP